MTKSSVKIYIYKFFGTLFLLCHVTSSFAGGVYLCPSKEGLAYQELPCRNNPQQKTLNTNPPPSAEQAPTQETEIVLTRDPDSQFLVDGTINDVGVKFLIDTGANITAIPEDIAKSAKLPMESQVVADTANGSTTDFKTTIYELKIGKTITLNNIPATIIKGNQALLGMNVLAKFDMTQKGDTLTLKLK